MQDNQAKKVVWPTFLMVGAPKAGTTSVYHYLRQHPEIFMSNVKEPHYFTLSGKDRERFPDAVIHGTTYTREEYLDLFKVVGTEKARGEESTGYLMSSTAAERIRHEIPDAKIIVVLRNPADRAFSGYLMKLRNAREWSSLETAFERGKVYVENSFYYNNLLRYYELFPRERIAIFLFEDMRRDPVAVMQRMYRFLEVDEGFLPETTTRHNEAWMPKNLHLNYIRNFILRAKRVREILDRTQAKRLFRKFTRGGPPEFPGEIRARLMDLYSKDIEDVEVLTGLDLSVWSEGSD